MSELYHFGFSKSKKSTNVPKKSFLYVAKIPLKNKKWRYFYDRSEYEAYLRGRQPSTNKIGNKLNGMIKPNVNAGKSNPLVGMVKPTINNALLKNSEKDPTTALKIAAARAKANNDKKKQANAVARQEVKNEIKDAAKNSVGDFLNKYQDKTSNNINAIKSKMDNNKANKDAIKNDPKAVINYMSGVGNKFINDVGDSKFGQKLKNIHYENEANKIRFDKMLGGVTLTDEQANDYVNHASVINSRYYNSKSDGWTAHSYSTNCQSCTVAFDLRMRGYDVEAAPAMDGLKIYNKDSGAMFKDTKPIKIEINGEKETVWVGNPTYNYIWSDYVYQDPVYKTVMPTKSAETFKAAEIAFEQDVVKDGSGSYGHISLVWNDGGAHTMNYYVSDNLEVVYIDCQTGKTYNSDEFLNVYEMSTGALDYFRSDNLSLNKDYAYNYAVKAGTMKYDLPSYIINEMTVIPDSNSSTGYIDNPKKKGK